MLARKRSLDESTNRNDREQRAIVEREFQTAIEACIDVAELLVKETGAEMPSTNAATFTTLAEAEVISSETAARMREAAGFRNVLAHIYGSQIDDGQVYYSLQHDLQWFTTFLRDVREHLDEDDD